MGTRGRKSQADLSVVSSDVQVQDRQDPPSDLTREQKDKWNALVGEYPATHFVGRGDLLKTFCRHLVAHDHIAQLIASCEEGDELDVKEYDRLLKMQERESGIIARLSVRLHVGHNTGRDTKSKKNRLRDWQ